MNLENYYFLAIALENIGFILTGFVMISGALYGIRARQPTAFKKIKSDLWPRSIMVIGLGAFLLLLTHRLNLAFDYDFLSNLAEIQVVDTEKIDTHIESNQRMAVLLDVFYLSIAAWVLLEYVLDFIEWLFREEESSDGSSNSN